MKISSTRRDACIHSGHGNFGCCDGGRAMPEFAPRNRVSQGGGQGSPAASYDDAVQVTRSAPGRESKQFGDQECPQHTCYVKGHGHAKIRAAKEGYALRQQLKNNSSKTVSRPPTIETCDFSQQALCGRPDPHYHYRTHIFPISDAITLDEAGSSITIGCSKQLRQMTRSTTALLQRVEGIKAVMLAHGTTDPEELENLENENKQQQDESDFFDEKHIDEEEDKNDFDEPTDLPLNGNRLSRDKVTLAVAVTTNSSIDTNKSPLISDTQTIVNPSATTIVTDRQFHISDEKYSPFTSLRNIPQDIHIFNTPTAVLQAIYNPAGLPSFLNPDRFELRERIVYNTTNTGKDVYDNGILNCLILWLCGSQTDLTRNTQFETMLPEYTQFKSVDSHAVNKFLGCNLDQYVSRKNVYGRKSWFAKFTGVKLINNNMYRDDVFDVVELLGYNSYSIEKIIHPLLVWLQTNSVTQSREVFGSDGKFRAFTRGQIMTVCQECPDYTRWRKLGDMYFENTVDYYVQLMAIRDVHKYFRQARADLSLRPLNEVPSAKNLCPSRGARS